MSTRYSTRHPTTRALHLERSSTLESPPGKATAMHSSEYHRIIADAHQFYRARFATSWAPAYLRSRRITATPDLGLGYASGGWRDLLLYLQGRGHGNEHLAQCGLFSWTRDQRLYDRLRDRVVFPIADADGSTVAFIARAHPTAKDSVPRWLNTSSSPIYEKRDHLYSPVSGRGQVSVVVEGPLDAIAVSLAAPTVTAFALCGTAVSARQAHTIGLSADLIVCALDGDDGGRAGTSRLRAHIPHAHGIELPSGIDPAHLWQHHGRDALLQHLAEHKLLLEHELITLLSQSPAPHIEDRIHTLRTALPLIASSPISAQAHLANVLITALQLAPETVTDFLIPELAEANLRRGAHFSGHPFGRFTARGLDGSFAAA
jgi:DNA primase